MDCLKKDTAPITEDKMHINNLDRKLIFLQS